MEIYNDAFIAIARERHPGLLGKPADIGWADVYDEVLVLLSAALAGRTTQLRGYVSMVDGPAGPEERVFDADWSPLRDESGQVAGSLQTLIETTARHRAEAALRESEARLAAALESVPAGIGLVDAEGGIQIGNEAFRRYLPGGAIPSRDPSELPRWRAWDDQGKPLAPDRFPGARALRGERVVPGQEMLFTGEDGQDVWTQVAAVPIRDAAGRVTAISTVVSDIDALKRTSQALRESQERQAFLLKLSDALRPLVDPAAIQEAAARILGEHLRASRVAYVEVAARSTSSPGTTSTASRRWRGAIPSPRSGRASSPITTPARRGWSATPAPMPTTRRPTPPTSRLSTSGPASACRWSRTAGSSPTSSST